MSEQSDRTSPAKPQVKRKYAGDTRGRPFRAGNPGRPKGSRNTTTLALKSMLDGQAEALTQKAIKLALDGDLTALRICLDRILPPAKTGPSHSLFRRLHARPTRHKRLRLGGCSLSLRDHSV